MAKATVDSRKLQKFCVSCGGPNDRLPLFQCSKCAAKDSERGKRYYGNNKRKVLERTADYYDENKERHKQWTDDWWKANSDKKKEYTKKYKLRAMQVVMAGGAEKATGNEAPKCVYCGCDDLRFLEINHKNGGGNHEYWATRTAPPTPTKLPKGRKDISYGRNFYNNIIRGDREVNDLEIACGPHNRWHYYKLKFGDAANQFQIIWKPVE